MINLTDKTKIILIGELGGLSKTYKNIIEQESIRTASAFSMSCFEALSILENAFLSSKTTMRNLADSLLKAKNAIYEFTDNILEPQENTKIGLGENYNNIRKYFAKVNKPYKRSVIYDKDKRYRNPNSRKAQAT